MLGFALLTAVAACVSPFSPDLNPSLDILVVEGVITDVDEQQTIYLSRSRSRADSMALSVPVRNASVAVIVNGSTTVPLNETDPGTYQLPPTFRGRVGESYQLRFRTAEGQEYESTVETMVAVPRMLKAYDRFNQNGFTPRADELPVPSNEIYVDFQDAPNERNFYQWRWRLYEMQDWCETCRQGRYYLRDIGPVGSGPIEVIGCVRDSSLSIFNYFDYVCRGPCWEIIYNGDINIFEDSYTNGQVQLGRQVANIPIYQLDPALLVIEQLSLTIGAYRYYKILQDQTQNTGTLADSPPAPTVGNVRNLSNNRENVVGYFSASSVSEIRYKLSRANVEPGPGRMFRGLFFALNRRLPNQEPPRGNPPLPGAGVPSAICVPSRTRTNVQPVGWNN